jgi:hypothetical protein
MDMIGAGKLGIRVEGKARWGPDLGGNDFAAKVWKTRQGDMTEQDLLRMLEKPPVNWVATEKLYNETWERYQLTPR